MSYLKILGGATIGVDAVAVAPFTGGGSVLAATTLVGSLAEITTITAATGAAAAGTAAGVAVEKSMSSKEKKELQNKLDEQNVRYELDKQKTIEKVDKVLKDSQRIYDYVIAMHAIGLAAANADGQISEEETEDIETFVSVIMAENFPVLVKNQIQNLTNNPPSLKTAYEYLKKAGLTEQGWEKVDNLIEMAISADDYEDGNEKAFREAWRVLKKVA